MNKNFTLPIIMFVLMVSTFLACQKPNYNVYDPSAQLKTDIGLIENYIKTNNLPYITDTLSNGTHTGFYYQILNPGVQPDSGKYIYKNKTLISVKYAGKLMGATSNFDQSDSVTLALGNLITCWQMAMLKIQPKGKIRFIASSVYGYGNASLEKIPANSNLQFEVELLKVAE